MSAVFRTDPRGIAPTASHLATKGHELLDTSLGQLDVLGALREDLGFEAIVPDSIVMTLGGLDVRVLSLAKLIEVKERAARPKDLAVLPLLRATLARSRGA